MSEKYLVEWECNPEDWDSIIEKHQRRMARRKKEPEKFSKLIATYMVVGEFRGFEVHETDNLEVLTDMYLDYTPEIKKRKITPLIDTEKFIELYKSKK